MVVGRWGAGRGWTRLDEVGQPLSGKGLRSPLKSPHEGSEGKEGPETKRQKTEGPRTF
jgi:hypothetical protein